MSDTPRLSRREFLAAAAAMPLIAAVAQKQETPAATNPKSLAKIFEGITLTDQYGKELNPAELYKDKPVAVMFGFGGCQMCQKIARTAAAIQAEADAKKTALPIIVLSVKPAQDRFTKTDTEEKPNPMREYVESYGNVGVRQFTDAKKSYADGKDIPQKDRLLQVTTTQDGKNSDGFDYAQEIQRRLAKAFPGTNLFSKDTEGSHSRYVTLFKNGVAAQTEAALPRMSETDNAEAIETCAKACAKKLVDAALEKETARAR